MAWGIDTRGSSMPISPLILYALVVIYASPAWFFTFLPLYLFVGSNGIMWKIYIAPVIGALIGFFAGLIAFGPPGDVEFWRIQLAPIIIGFTLFLSGALSKKVISDPGEV